jgi:hypothetical protein
LFHVRCRTVAEVVAALTRLGVTTDDEPLVLRSLAKCGIRCRGRWLRWSVDPSTDACRADVLELFDAKRVVRSCSSRLQRSSHQLLHVVIAPQVRSDDIKSVVSKRTQASKTNKVMASILPEFATFQAQRSPSALSLTSFNRLRCAGAKLLGIQR